MVRGRIPRFKEFSIFKKYVLKKRGLFSNYPSGVSSDIVVEPPVFVGDVVVSKHCRIGRRTYILSGTLWANVTIGRYCSISDNVLLGPPDHPTQYLTTWDSFYKHTDYYKKWIEDKITVLGNDVWVGANVLIRKGVHVEDGAVIAAGAVVTENVPAYAIAGGIPAKVLKYRFDEKTINRLVELKWWNYDESILWNLPFNNIEKCIAMISSKKGLIKN